MDLLLFLRKLCAHLGERFTLQAGPLLLSILHKLSLSLLGLAPLLINLSFALLLLLALPAEKLLPLYGDPH